MFQADGRNPLFDVRGCSTLTFQCSLPPSFWTLNCWEEYVCRKHNVWTFLANPLRRRVFNYDWPCLVDSWQLARRNLPNSGRRKDAQAPKLKIESRSTRPTKYRLTGDARRPSPSLLVLGHCSCFATKTLNGCGFHLVAGSKKQHEAKGSSLDRGLRYRRRGGS